MMKLCRDCGTEKPLDEFHNDRSKPDGRNAYCKVCARVRTKRFLSRPPRNPDPEGLKRCQRCKELKASTDFFNSSQTYDGLSKVCRPCSLAKRKAWGKKNPEKLVALQRQFHRNNPQKQTDYHLKATYGLPHGSYERMLAEQGNACGICGTTDPGGRGRFHVDHCHDTRLVRSLLCHNCNVGIGHFQHDKQLLLKAINYLENQPKVAP